MGVYVCRFVSPLGSDKHSASFYIGWVDDSRRDPLSALEERLAVHRAGQGAAITRHASLHNIAFSAVVFFPFADKTFERWLKRKKSIPRFLATHFKEHHAMAGRFDKTSTSTLIFAVSKDGGQTFDKFVTAEYIAKAVGIAPDTVRMHTELGNLHKPERMWGVMNLYPLDEAQRFIDIEVEARKGGKRPRNLHRK